MDINTGKNWKFNIAFDDNAYNEILQHSFLYESKERDILNYQIDFYRKHFTFEQLLKAFRTIKPDDVAQFKNAVIKRKRYILYMPKQLKQYYLNIINTDYKNDSEFLTEMLLTACNANSDKNPMMPVYRKILGVYFTPVKLKIEKYKSRRMIKPKLQPLNTDPVLKAQHIIKEISLDTLSQGIWGKFGIENLRILCNSDLGKGKYHSRYFYSGKTNTYMIQTNKDTISPEELNLSVYLNVYPGRGHLINQLMYKRSYNLDGGAEFVMHGWSLFSAWHYKNNQFTKYTKILYSKIADPLLHGNWQESLTKIYHTLLNNFPKEDAMRLMILITQYPGKFESYIMGALATEQLIVKKFATSPMGLIDEYKKRNVADFFGLFKPNTNKC